jgi:hypothetical protein
MSYFANFPLQYYSFGNKETPVLFQDLTVYLDLIDQLKDQSSFYQYHNIFDGDRPDTLSYKIYGDSRYYWTFFLMNEHLRVSGWPLPVQSLDAVIKDNYPHWTIVTKDNISNSEFVPGSVVRGSVSGTTGTIIEVNLEMNQIVVDTKGYEIRRTTELQEGIPSFTLKTEAETGFRYFDLTEILVWQPDYSVNSIAAVYNANPTENILTPLSNLASQYELRNNKLYLKASVPPPAVPYYVDYFYRFFTNRNFNSGEELVLQNVDTPELKSIEVLRSTKQYNSVHHYENTNGEYVDIDPFTQSVSGLIPVTYNERAIARNDTLKQIKIIKPDAINQVVSEFRKYLKDN